MRVIISTSTKFHAFAMAEQFQKNKILHTFFTSYSSIKNTVVRNFISRNDKELISSSKIMTILPLAVLMRWFPKYSYYWNDIFDFWVSRKLKSILDYDVFVGWSGMSLRSIRTAKKNGKIVILERSSSHILFQDNLLNDEYTKFGINFRINSNVIRKELLEYEESDYISVPSDFVRDSFINYGVKQEKIIKNPFGFSSHFINSNVKLRKFTVVYLGALSIRKGLIYLFEAVKLLEIDKNQIEIKFVGNISDEIKPLIKKYREWNWVFTGHVNHYDISNTIAGCDVAVHPSIEEGLSVVIVQLLACGIPVIATENTGAREIVRDGYNGYVVPIRNSEKIAERIEILFNNKILLEEMKNNAVLSAQNGFTWNEYGNRWKENLARILQ